MAAIGDAESRRIGRFMSKCAVWWLSDLSSTRPRRLSGCGALFLFSMCGPWEAALRVVSCSGRRWNAYRLGMIQWGGHGGGAALGHNHQACGDPGQFLPELARQIAYPKLAKIPREWAEIWLQSSLGQVLVLLSMNISPQRSEGIAPLLPSYVAGQTWAGRRHRRRRPCLATEARI